MGQSLIEALAEDQLDGTLTFSTASEEGGTRCHLSFPKETNDSTESLPTES
jgi:two-component sensor histidine kinase